MPRRRSIPSRCCALRSMFGRSEARLGMATKPASSRTISASAPRGYRSTCSRDCPLDEGARSSATAAESIAQRLWPARIGPPSRPSLRLGLHLLELRAPLGELRLHLGDVGVLHLLHSHGSLLPAGRRDTLLPFLRARRAGCTHCLPVRSSLPQLAHAPHLLQEREQDLGLPGAVVPLAVDEEGR